MDRQDVLDAFCTGFNAYLVRTKQTSKELTKKISCSEANVSKWKKFKGLPSLEVVFKLVKNGMTLQEVFGKDMAEKLSVDFQKNLVSENPTAAKNFSLQLLEFLNEKIKEFKAV